MSDSGLSSFSDRSYNRTPMLDHVHVRLLTYRFVRLTPARWKLRNIQDSFWRFYLHDSDGASIEHINNTTHLLEKGRLYFIPAGIRFHTSITNEVGQFFAHFDVIGLPSIARREIFYAPICLSAHPALEKLAWTLLHETATPKEMDLVLQFRVKAIIYEGLAHYLHSLPIEQLQRQLQLASALEPVLPAIRYIEEHIAERLLSSELAQLCHMNVDYFARRFRECVGQTPGQYIQEQRVKLASELLLFTDQSIEQISANTGFGSRFYFTRVFARHTGLSPATYRKTVRYT